jgi:2,3-bisphosphoglycerate-independent phosphoglycerate mutase
MTTSPMKKNKLLLILDGWGHSNDRENNAILMAKTPNWDSLIANYPNTLIGTSGNSVGLPDGQMGNSEVGHLTIGSGRTIEQDFTRIQKDIDSGTFVDNPALSYALNSANQGNGAVHIIGLLSDGGVHSHQKHIHAMLDMTKQKGSKEVYLHLITDGRDTPPQSAATFVSELEEKINELNTGRIASIVGRFYAMDRDNRWGRIEKAYNLLSAGKSEYTADSADIAIQMAYDRGESDEFIAPTAIGAPAIISNGDAVIFMNYRADRARELTQSIAVEGFAGFPRETFLKTHFVCLAEYKKDFNLPCAYLPVTVNNTLGSYLSDQGFSQLRIAETEKYAHVTFFFNGGSEPLMPGEKRKLIPSPDVETYDLKPEMSAFELTGSLADAIKSKQYDLIVCNFANTDMVGHSGKIEATIKAVEAVDSCLGIIHQACMENGSEMLITADHGNAEQMTDPTTNKPHTAHTTNPVPLLYVSNRDASIAEPFVGTLADLAPTMLALMDIEPPKEMTGKCLLNIK